MNPPYVGCRVAADAAFKIGGVEAAPHMVRHVAEALDIDSDEQLLETALDGEPTDLRVPLSFRSRAGALQLLAAPPRTEG